MTSRPGARLKAVLRASATFTCPRVLDQTAHADGRARADAASGRPERSRNNFLEPGNEGHASNILHHFLLSALLSSSSDLPRRPRGFIQHSPLHTAVQAQAPPSIHVASSSSASLAGSPTLPHPFSQLARAQLSHVHIVKRGIIHVIFLPAARSSRRVAPRLLTYHQPAHLAERGLGPFVRFAPRPTPLPSHVRLLP